MSFPIYLHEDFIQVPFPMTGLHSPCPASFDLVCKLRAKSVLPISKGFIANIYATFMKKVFHTLKESGNLTYNITASWMISGLVLK